MRTITRPPISSRRIRFGEPTSSRSSGVTVAAFSPSPCSRIAAAAYEEAARLYSVALETLELVHPPDEQARCELLLAVGESRVCAGEFAAAKTLARYAVEQSSHRSKVKPHDLIISALEDWFQKHGLPGPVRALEPKPSIRKGRGQE